MANFVALDGWHSDKPIYINADTISMIEKGPYEDTSRLFFVGEEKQNIIVKGSPIDVSAKLSN